MNTLINIWGSCLDRVKGIAVNISATFTGGDSSAVLLMIVFYLVVLIVILLLLKVIGSGIRSLFYSIFPPKKRKSKRFSTKNTAPQPDLKLNQDDNLKTSPAHSQESRIIHPSELLEAVSFLESFDEKKFLDRLSSSYKTLSRNCVIPADPILIESVVPESLIVKEFCETLSAEEKLAIESKFVDCDLISLRQMLDTEIKREPDLTFNIHGIKNRIVSSCREREKLAEQEVALMREYNSNIESFIGCRFDLQNVLNTLSSDYSVISRELSDTHEKRLALLECVQEFAEDAKKTIKQVDCFGLSSFDKINNLSSDLTQKDTSLKDLLDRYYKSNTARKTADKEISSYYAEMHSLCRERLVNKETVAILTAAVESKEKIEAERLAREALERAAREKAEQLAREEAERKEREEAERAAREEAERKEKEEAERRAENERIERMKQQEQDDAMANIQQHAENAYVLNFDDLTPEMRKKLADDINRTKQNKATNSEEKDVSEPPATSEEIPESNERIEEKQSEESVDHFARLQEEWAAEREHKLAWETEQAIQADAIQRRKKELLEKLNSGTLNQKKS